MTQEEIAVKDPPIVGFRCPRDLKRKLSIKAAEQETSVQALLIEAVRRYLGADGTAA